MDKKQTTIAIIPARGGSKGIPNKNTMQIAGKPLIAWTIEQSLSSTQIDYTFVSTDDDHIAEISTQYGAEVIKRPSIISGDKSRTEDALIHALDILKSIYKIDVELIVLLQATSPLRKTFDISKAVSMFKESDFDTIFSATKIADLTLWHKPQDKWESVNFDYKKRLRRQDRTAQYIENGSIYITKPDYLIKEKNIVGGKIGVFEMDLWQTWEIDTIDEVDLVEYFINSKLKNETKLEISKEEIELIVFDFDGVMTNNKALLMENGQEGIVINRADGVGVSNLKKMGIPMLILTSEANSVVKIRAKKLKLEILANIEDKKSTLKEYLNKNKIDRSKTIYIGNDLNDLEVMKWVGYPICPADSHNRIKEISKIILDVNGGEGVTRTLFDILIN